MIAHHVLFWLKADTTEDQKKSIQKRTTIFREH